MKPSAKPYPGLRPFETEEKDLFFGREAECAILVDKILAHRLTLLFAASGAGKSSLLRAAVLPELEDPEGENLSVVVYRDWVEEPIAGLRQAIVAAVEASKRVPAGTFGEDLGALSLFELCELAVLFVRPPLVLMLDQFEELFRYQRRAATFERFLAELGRLVAERSLPVSVVLSMREDFALELNALKPFLPGPLFENYFRLERMPVEQAREAIEAPAKKAGFEYEEELLEALLVDLADRDDEVSPVAELGEGHRAVEPPYLQIVCSELWELEQGAEGRKLRFSTYTQNGRAAGLSKKYVERILGGLSAREKVLASRAFDHLITRRGTKMAYTAADLASAIRAPEAALEATLDRLQKAKILRQQSRRGVFWYELHHDLFSRVVEDWNQKFKAGQRRRQVAAGAALCVLAAGVLWVAYDAAVNWTTYYLRLDVRPGLSDAVEVYRGKPGSPDFLRLGGYLAETGIDRMDIEPHRSFDMRLLQNLEQVEVEAAGFLRAGIHVERPWRAGHAREALALATEALNTTDREVAGQVTDPVMRFGSLEGLEVLERFQAALATSEVTRAAIAETLKPGPRAAVRRLSERELIAMLSSSERSVRLGAADALESQGGVRSVAPLIARLSNPDPGMRWIAARALGSLGSLEALAPLIALLSDPIPSVRSSAASALVSLGSPEVAAPLIALLSDSESTVRQSVALALGSFGSPEVTAPLIALLSDPTPNVRGSAAKALGSLGSPEALAPLIALLSDPHGDVRSNASYGLELLGNPEAAAPLIELLSDSTPAVGRTAASALVSLGSPEVAAPLIELLSDSKSNVRQNVASALGSLSPEASAPLIALLSDPDWTVRGNAAIALGSLGSPEALAPLISLLSRPYGGDSFAPSALGSLGSPEVLVPLISRLPNPAWRLDVVDGLGSLGSPEASASLISLLSDPELWVRQNAVDALGSLGSMEATGPLIALCSDESDIRGLAARALGRLGRSEAVTPLITALAREAPGKREPLMLALAALGATSARDEIVGVYLEEVSRPKPSVPDFRETQDLAGFKGGRRSLSQ